VKISVVVIVRNEEKRIHDFLESIINQELIHENEVLFVDGYSSDTTVSIIKEYCKEYQFIRLIECIEYGYSYQRNIGSVYAKGDYVLYVSGDTILSKNLIKKYIYYIDDYDVIQGTILNTDNNSTISKNFYQICSNLYNNYINTDCETFSTVNVCIKRELLLNKKFDESLDSLEDKEWFLSYDKSIKYKRLKNAVILHLVHENVKQYSKKVHKEATALGIIIGRNKQYNWKNELDFFGWCTFARSITAILFTAVITSGYMFLREQYLVALLIILLPVIYKHLYLIKRLKYSGKLMDKIERCVCISILLSAVWTGMVKGYIKSKVRRLNSMNGK
jgi:glycosyltransferase involved in cell wall biosynthesis